MSPHAYYPCVRASTMSVVNGVSSIRTDARDWGELFTHEYDANHSMACWKPGASGSVDVSPVEIYPGGPESMEWQNATEFAMLISHYGNQFLSYNATDATWYDGPFTVDVDDDGFASAAFSEIASAGINTIMARIAASWTKYALIANDRNVIRGDVLVLETP